jgi:hypothetical protein
VNADSAKKMSQRLDETPRSIPHAIGRQNVCANIEHPSESSCSRNISVVTVPMGYALVQVRVKDPSFRGKLCPTLVECGECPNHTSCCDYSHSLEEVRSFNQHYRTKLCEFASNGFCKKGKACRFAHSSEELGTYARSNSDTTTTCQGTSSSSVLLLRDSSMVSTEPPTPLNSTGGSIDFAFERIQQIPLSESPYTSESNLPQASRVCYKAPPEQRILAQPYSSSNTRFRKSRYPDLQRPPMIPSSYHYVDNLKYVVSSENRGLPINAGWRNNSGPFVLATAPVHVNGGSGGYPPGMFYAMPIMYNTRSDSVPTSFTLCPQQYVD